MKPLQNNAHKIKYISTTRKDFLFEFTNPLRFFLATVFGQIDKIEVGKCVLLTKE